MTVELKRLIETSVLAADEIAARTYDIYQRLLRESPYLDGGNFTRLHTRDLRRLFELYDEVFFAGHCRATLGAVSLEFQISSRMTKAGGKTTRFERRDPRSGTVQVRYEISVSAVLLFQTFQHDITPAAVGGLPCQNRLEALQRVFEHELVHLLEMLVWTKSNCRGPRFQSIARRLFGHVRHTHELVTPQVRALTKFGIRAGDRVQFRFDGQHYAGVVNRITKRATVLVEAPAGPRYSDGKHYKKFYVPISLLEPAQ